MEGSPAMPSGLLGSLSCRAASGLLSMTFWTIIPLGLGGWELAKVSGAN